MASDSPAPESFAIFGRQFFYLIKFLIINTDKNAIDLLTLFDPSQNAPWKHLMFQRSISHYYKNKFQIGWSVPQHRINVQFA